MATPKISLGTVEVTTPQTQINRMSTVIWGPSGAGKTTLAAQLAESQLQRRPPQGLQKPADVHPRLASPSACRVWRS